MTYISPEVQRRIEELFKVSKGAIESIIVTKPDGTPTAYVNLKKIHPDFLAAAVSSVAGVLSSILETLELGYFKRLHVELEDKRFIFVVPLGSDVVAITTKPSPNVGFIDLLIDLYLK
ncbi:MAG: roadblock/LC7 domain-containing protein [Aigarchaeota archaeon]|nr:roadblock/LC7 domain-containing protein [Aigarchaeota archaeon]MDW8092490.1 roadblock/LC7 domain-containing protein [Nitrososphaerota archaeon]